MLIEQTKTITNLSSIAYYTLYSLKYSKVKNYIYKIFKIKISNLVDLHLM